VAYATELIETAKKLLSNSGSKQPSVSDCNRAVSTAYYAVFDCLCSTIADRISGGALETHPMQDDWLRLFRSIDHKKLRDALVSVKGRAVATWSGYADISSIFNKLQEAREEADYNHGRLFDHDEASQLLFEAEICIFEVDHARAENPSYLSALIVALFIKSTR
jgi:uncharacterized protein (UPF0332 family)